MVVRGLPGPQPLHSCQQAVGPCSETFTLVSPVSSQSLLGVLGLSDK